MRYYLTLDLQSDATFGRGEGLAGLVDVEIEHDEAGCPFLGGRSLKGMLVEEWANLRYALRSVLSSDYLAWDAVATHLFGTTGAMYAGAAGMRVGPATLPPELHAILKYDVSRGTIQPHQILDTLTAIRRQTAMDATTGSPDPGSLRSMRVLLRGTPLIATLDFERSPDDNTLALLAACVLATRRGGTGRNRGRGRLSMLLHAQKPEDYRDMTFTKRWFEHFAHSLQGVRS